MASSGRSLTTLLQDLRTAASLLEVAERDWPDALRAELPDEEMPEVSQVEELLHVATHETASALAMTLQDIDALLQRVQLRRRFAIFSGEQFDRIVREGWSTRLAAELRGEIPSISLAEISAHVRQLCTDWGRLPRVAAARHRRHDTAADSQER